MLHTNRNVCTSASTPCGSQLQPGPIPPTQQTQPGVSFPSQNVRSYSTPLASVGTGLSSASTLVTPTTNPSSNSRPKSVKVNSHRNCRFEPFLGFLTDGLSPQSYPNVRIVLRSLCIFIAFTVLLAV